MVHISTAIWVCTYNPSHNPSPDPMLRLRVRVGASLDPMLSLEASVGVVYYIHFEPNQ